MISQRIQFLFGVSVVCIVLLGMTQQREQTTATPKVAPSPNFPTMQAILLGQLESSFVRSWADQARLGPGIVEGAPSDAGALFEAHASTLSFPKVTIQNLGDCTVQIIGTSGGSISVAPGRSVSAILNTVPSPGGRIDWIFANDGLSGRFAWVIKQ